MKIMKKTIFIAEDNEVYLKLVKAVVNTMPDLEVIMETEGGRALELIKKDNPDLIILDIQLPGINGIEICKELRKLSEFKNTPIIAMTGYPEDFDESIVSEAGFNKFFSKPIELNDFIKSIQDFLSI